MHSEKERNYVVGINRAMVPRDRSAPFLKVRRLKQQLFWQRVGTHFLFLRTLFCILYVVGFILHIASHVGDDGILKYANA